MMGGLTQYAGKLKTVHFSTKNFIDDNLKTKKPSLDGFISAAINLV